MHCLHDEMQKFMKKLATTFIKPEANQKLKEDKLLFSKLDTSLQN